MNRRRFSSAMAVAALAAATTSFAGLRPAAASDAASADSAKVTGSVTWRERIAVKPGMVLDVELLDTSRADAPAIRMAQRRYALDKVPFGFSLETDAALIEDNHRYTVAARVFDGGRVAWRSTSAHAVLTGGAPNEVEILVERMAAPASVLDESHWQVVQLNGAAVESPKPPTVSFLADGGLAVFSGCNRHHGSVVIDGDGLTVNRNMAGTKMACLPPLDVLERDLVAALFDTVRFSLRGDRLILLNAEGAPVLVLERAG
ncbi:YbaY family lipoprotein [Pukyongiella litopenaei]|uniref:META domain-containing protein n=1 Tax=Pukyongiella litopenaei TaxID=2605946 RepID=A0A2S0MKY3_9RHOB|nr:YbaY family lipoprotein [Pukyongiella litopenaei]AVO36522.1 META domain-containing protein [Pukyongiella litopenaei]